MDFEQPKFESKLEIKPEEGEKKEAKEKESREIETIENFDLGKQDRMNLILTYLGEKPTSEIEIEYDGKKPLLRPEEIVSKKEGLERLLTEAGMKFKILEREWTDENGFDQREFRFLIGKEEKKVKELEEALSEGNNERIGKLFGYPQSAVEAFLKGMEKVEKGGVMDTVLDERKWWQELSQEERAELAREKVLNFLNFKLSKEYWREELETVREWQRVIKEKAPRLYQEISEEKRETIMTEKEKKEYEREEAEKELELIREKVEKMKDRLGKPIERGIKETVVMLNAFDFRTSQSCQGHLERGVGPWVEIYPKVPETEKWYENPELREKVIRQRNYYSKKAINLLSLFYQERKVPFDVMLGFQGIGYGFRIQSQGAEIIGTLEKEERKKKLKQYRKEMKDFTKFLKEHYPDYLFRRLEI